MPSPSGPIEHVVVLMMENRSFDHMLGFLPREGHLKNFEGLTDEEIKPPEPGAPTSQKFFNFADPAKDWRTFPVRRGACYKMEGLVRGIGPPHDLVYVNRQLTNTDDGPSGTRPATNHGFVRAWDQYLRECGVKQPTTGELQRVMECFTPEQLPVLSTLAKEFVLCDHWFCSVPGPTMPNRLFVHAATSCGYAHNAFGTEFSCRTIYRNLAEAGYTWSVYHQKDSFDLVQDFTELDYSRHKNNPNDLNFREYALFRQDINDGTLAHYSFINPRFIDWRNPLTANAEVANSQHAPCDVRPGEVLIAEVYNALRESKVWEKTLLVILYDEHGGFYDHVPPPTTPDVLNPDGHVSDDPFFEFTRLGLRVPAILISPWLPRKLDSTVYEHSSLLATVKKLFKLPKFLTHRDANAKSFEHWFEGAQLRDKRDTPEVTPLEAELSNVQWGQLLDSVQKEVMEGVKSHLPAADRHEAAAQLLAGTMTLGQASAFQQKAMSHFKTRVIANGGRHPHA